MAKRTHRPAGTAGCSSGSRAARPPRSVSCTTGSPRSCTASPTACSDDEDAADRVTREVFAYVWENPDAYDPKQGSLRSWVATLTHRQAVQRLRATETAALAEGGEGTARGAGAEGAPRLRRRPRRLHRHLHAGAAARRPGAGVLPAPRLPPDRRRPRRHRGRGPPPAAPGPPAAVHRPRPVAAPRRTARLRTVRCERRRPRTTAHDARTPTGTTPRPGRPATTRTARTPAPTAGRRRPTPRHGDPPDAPMPRGPRRGQPGCPLPAPGGPPVTRHRRPPPAPCRTPCPEVAARRLGAGRLLRRGDRGRRGAPRRLRALRGRGAAAARGGRAAAHRPRASTSTRCCAPGSWRAAWAAARRASRCPAGRRRTTRRPPGWTPCCGTSATPSGTRRCGCAGSRASAPTSRRTTVAGVIAHLMTRRRLVARALGPGRPAGRRARPGARLRPRAPRRTGGRSHVPPTRAVREPWREQSHALVRTVSFAGRAAPARLAVSVRRLRPAAARRDAGPGLRVLGARGGHRGGGGLPVRAALAAPPAPHDRPGGPACCPTRWPHAAAPGSPHPPRPPPGRGGRPGPHLHLEIEGRAAATGYIPLDSPAAVGSAEHEVAQSPWTASSSAGWPPGHVRRRRRRRARWATGRRSGTSCSRRPR